MTDLTDVEVAVAWRGELEQTVDEFITAPDEDDMAKLALVARDAYWTYGDRLAAGDDEFIPDEGFRLWQSWLDETADGDLDDQEDVRRKLRNQILNAAPQQILEYHGYYAADFMPGWQEMGFVHVWGFPSPPTGDEPEAWMISRVWPDGSMERIDRVEADSRVVVYKAFSEGFRRMIPVMGENFETLWTPWVTAEMAADPVSADDMAKALGALYKGKLNAEQWRALGALVGKPTAAAIALDLPYNLDSEFVAGDLYDELVAEAGASEAEDLVAEHAPKLHRALGLGKE